MTPKQEASVRGAIGLICAAKDCDMDSIRQQAEALRLMNEAIITIREALVEPVQEPVAWMHNEIEGNIITHRPSDIDRHPERWTALYKKPMPCPTCESLARAVMLDQTYYESRAVAEPAQEPVAKVELMTAWQEGYDQGVADERTSDVNIGISGFGAKVTPARNNPYSAPPTQCTWVGLTDEEVDEWTPEIHTVIRAIEAKLKEKNT